MKNSIYSHSLKLKSTGSAHQPEVKRMVKKKSLVNILNYLNFQDRQIEFHLSAIEGDDELSIDIKPLPIFGDFLTCLWPEEFARHNLHQVYQLDHVSIPDKNDVIDLTPDIRSVNARGICIRLPETCMAVPDPVRMNRSFEEIRVRLEQNSHNSVFEIADFRDSTVTIAAVKHKSNGSQAFELGLPVNASFVKAGKILYQGQFNLTGQNDNDDLVILDIELPNRSIHRYPPRKYRCYRYTLKPTPDVFFTHPFTGKYCSMDVSDISGAGFSIIEEDDNALLLTGMVIQGVELRFSGALAISCDTQIVHRSVMSHAGGPKLTRTGFAFIHMTVENHLKLQSILQQCDNTNTRVCNPVDTGDLWDFFFETGFIYSKKYRSFTDKKNVIKNIYKKLYNQPNSISRHFTYQEKGKILGHMSMLHFYTDSWLIHHHAALKKASIKAGLSVLNQVARYIIDCLWLDSCHMKYVQCYFRPDNAFPNFFFNGFTEKLNDRKGCSTDTFAYYTHKNNWNEGSALPYPYKLDESTPLDLKDLDTFYNRHSGGLLVKALDLSPDSKPQDELNALYHESGFKKERKIFSLRHKGDLAAIILANVTDMAINMSDLTNCLTLIVMDEEAVTPDILTAVLNNLSSLYTQKRFPVLLFPRTFADSRQIPYQKEYILWILSTQYSDHYFEYLNQVNALGAEQN